MVITQSLGRVLVIDDNPDFRDLIGNALTQAGYEVTLARDGSEGVEAQRRRASDLALTDIFMPEKDGLEIIGLFKKEFPGTPIIAMSGTARFGLPGAQIDYLLAARRFGADRVLYKPFGVDSLLAAVREVLSGPPKSGERAAQLNQP